MVLPLPVPASVYGLVLLLAALTAGIVKLEQVKETGTYLTGIFPLLFVPAAAGIMELWAEMGQLLLPILIAILPVTVLVMAAAGRTTQEGILKYLIAGGDLSMYGLSNAVTRVSQDVESYDRATTLEGIGWQVATMEPAQWKQINQ